MKKILLLILFFIITIMPIKTFAAEVLTSQRGEVVNVEYVDIDNDIAQVKQLVEVKLLNGENKGQVILLDNMQTGNPYYDIKLKSGKKVLLHVETIDDELVYSIEDLERSHILYGLTLIFLALLIYVGRKKGFYSFVSIIVTSVLIFNVLSPMILHGLNPILSTFFICILSTMLTMYLVGGFNKKSTSAIIGCTLSLVFAGILSQATIKLASITGFSNEHSMFLYSVHPELNFVSITISAMILATLGAVMDVGMSIASTINEIYTIDNSKTVKELFKSGMNVGRDIIGTMANTLILVYLGASLPLLLLASNLDLQKFINLNQVVTEISSALIGSSAIILCVPLTAIVASELIKNTSNKIDKLPFEE